jgi:hypothetical protein
MKVSPFPPTIAEKSQTFVPPNQIQFLSLKYHQVTHLHVVAYKLPYIDKRDYERCPLEIASLKASHFNQIHINTRNPNK